MSQPVSVIAPVRSAIDTTRRLLFAPFDLVKWLGLGFTAWLAMLSDGGWPANFGNLLGGPPDAQPFQAASAWIQAHVVLVVALAACAGVAILAAALAVAWVSSRGKFMFLDNVVRDRAEIVEPWQRTRRQGNSYFLFSIGFGLACLAALGVIVLVGVLIAMPDLSRQTVGANAVAALALGGLLFGLYLLALTAALIFLEDFIIPIMFLRSCRALEAWSEFFGLFQGHAGVFLLYALFKIALGWALAMVSLGVCCCLCCVMWIPYVSTVILLPLFVFLRCYALHFLEQFGARYRLFADSGADYLALAP